MAMLDELPKRTFAIKYSELRISWSSSVPKMADICDIGLHTSVNQITDVLVKCNVTYHGCHASTCGPLYISNYHTIPWRRISTLNLPYAVKCLSSSKIGVVARQKYFPSCDVRWVRFVQEPEIG